MNNKSFLEKLDDLFQNYVEGELISRDEIKGVLPDEIESFEQGHGIRLPPTYKDFLLYCGYEPISITGGSTLIIFPELHEFQMEVKELVSEGRLPRNIDERAIFFRCEDGDNRYSYFLCDGTDNPEVVVLHEAEISKRHEARIERRLLSQILLDRIETGAASYSNWKDRNKGMPSITELLRERPELRKELE